MKQDGNLKGGSADMMTQSALKSLLAEVRGSARFYEEATRRHGKHFAFAELARTERRHERLLLTLFQSYNVSVPEPPIALPVPPALSETLRLALGLEAQSVNECSHYLSFLKQQDIVDIFTIVKITARDLHRPALQKKLGPSGPPPLTPAQVKQLRERLSRNR